MKVTTHGMIYVGRVELVKKLHTLSKRQQEQVADMIADYAVAIRKCPVGAPCLDIYVDLDTERGE